MRPGPLAREYKAEAVEATAEASESVVAMVVVWPAAAAVAAVPLVVAAVLPAEAASLAEVPVVAAVEAPAVAAEPAASIAMSEAWPAVWAVVPSAPLLATPGRTPCMKESQAVLPHPELMTISARGRPRAMCHRW